MDVGIDSWPMATMIGSDFRLGPISIFLDRSPVFYSTFFLKEFSHRSE